MARVAVSDIVSSPQNGLIASGNKDTKVTDMLIKTYHDAEMGKDTTGDLQDIKARYNEIIHGLNLKNFSLDEDFKKIAADIKEHLSLDYLASRGEYLNGKIMAEYLGYDFIDAKDVIFFNEEGHLNTYKTNKVLGAALKEHPHAVIPGFYGCDKDGNVKTFSRGGSDVTGSIVAGAAKVDVYENWTDVSGMLSADPRIVKNPSVINFITYTELRELSYMGASVLHEDAVFPVRKAGIPINIRNTNSPDDKGTLISASLPKDIKRSAVTGIAGRKGFCSIRVEKSMMNGETGFGAKLLYIFAKNDVPFEHCPTGIDTISVIVNSALFDSKREEILREIKNSLEPDFITIEKNLAAIAVVGEGMVNSKGMAAKIFTSLANAGINIRMIDQGSDELNIIVGIDEADYEAAINALYSDMIK